MNLLQRNDNDLLIRHIDVLREAVKWVRHAHPFTIHAWVVLPKHMHCMILLPPDDADFALRWRLIKMRFSKTIPDKEWISATRQRRGERGIWQRRYREHLIERRGDLTSKSGTSKVFLRKSISASIGSMDEVISAANTAMCAGFLLT